MVRHADANGDGAVTRDEAMARREVRFARRDANADGVIDEAEIDAAVRARVELVAKRVVHKYDRDRDGKITREEFDRFAGQRFSWLDLNDDGTITPDEAPHLKRRGQGGR